MKKLVFVIIYSLFVVSVYSQSVFGIKLGSSYEPVKEALKERFGSYRVIEDGGNLSVINPTMGEFEFSCAEFYFQRGVCTTWLNHVYIQQNFNLNELKNAKSMRESVANILMEKYHVFEYINQEGFKSYHFGKNPKNEKEPLGYLYLTKSKGKDNKQRYYLILEYGPIYYIDKSADF